jgi:hypothetical protein
VEVEELEDEVENKSQSESEPTCYIDIRTLFTRSYVVNNPCESRGQSSLLPSSSGGHPLQRTAEQCSRAGQS